MQKLLNFFLFGLIFIINIFVINNCSNGVGSKSFKLNVEVESFNYGFKAYSLMVAGKTIVGQIDEKTKNIKFSLPSFVNISQLIAKYELFGDKLNLSHIKVDVNNKLQVNGETANDFSSPLSYQLVYGKEINNYLVNVKLESFIKFFKINNQYSSIDDVNKVIYLHLRESENISSLYPVFELFDGVVAKVNGVVQTSGKSFQNFNKKIVYDFIFGKESVSYTVNII